MEARNKIAAEIEAARAQGAETELRTEAERLASQRRLTPAENAERRAAQFERDRTAREERETAALKGAYRARYVASAPSTTVEDFEAAWPELLKQHRRDAAMGRTRPAGAYADPEAWGLNR